MYDKNSDYRKQLYMMLAIVLFVIFVVGAWAYGDYLRKQEKIVTFSDPVAACRTCDIKRGTYREIIGTYITCTTTMDRMNGAGNREVYVTNVEGFGEVNLIYVCTNSSSSVQPGSTVTIHVTDTIVSIYNSGRSLMIIGDIVDV